MTDIELIRKCAEKMGLEINCWENESSDGGFYCKLNRYDYYNPLTDDAQAMALVKKFQLDIEYGALDKEWSVISWETDSGPAKSTSNADLNRAICECVARLP